MTTCIIDISSIVLLMYRTRLLGTWSALYPIHRSILPQIFVLVVVFIVDLFFSGDG